MIQRSRLNSGDVSWWDAAAIRWRRVAGALLVVMVVAACQTTNSDYGRGPITLSTTVQICVDQYLAHETPLVLAVAVDGRSGCGYTYCREFRCINLPANAVAMCHARSKGVPCKIYAVERRIVWQTTPGVSASPSPASRHAPWRSEPDVSCRSRTGVVSTMKEHLCRKFGGEVIP